MLAMANGNGGNGKTAWLIGVLVAMFISLLSYVWVDREGRIADLERRVELREKAWYDARYKLQERISDIEHDIKSLKVRLGMVEPRPEGGPPR